MYKKIILKKNEGITLIALIITIIVLLILATVTLNLLSGNNGIISRAKESSEQSNIEKGREQIDLVLAEDSIVRTKTKELLTLDRLENIFNEKEWVEKTEKWIEEGIIEITNEQGYIYEIIISEQKAEEVVYIGKNSDPKPVIVLSIEAEHESGNKTANIKIDAEEKVNGIAKIEIIQTKKVIQCNGEEEVEKLTEVNKNGLYVVRVTSITGRASRATIIVTQVIQAEFTEVVWVGDGTAKIGITAKLDLPIQYSLTGLEGAWIEYTIGQEITGLVHEQTVHARLLQSNQGLGYVEITILDKILPNEFDISISDVEDASFKVNASTIDEQTGIKEYRYYVGGELVGTTSRTDYEVTDLESATLYEDIYVEAIDEGDNIRKSTNTLSQKTTYGLLSEAPINQGDKVNYESNGFADWIILSNDENGVKIISSKGVAKLSAHAKFEPNSWSTLTQRCNAVATSFSNDDWVKSSTRSTIEELTQVRNLVARHELVFLKTSTTQAWYAGVQIVHYAVDMFNLSTLKEEKVVVLEDRPTNPLTRSTSCVVFVTLTLKPGVRVSDYVDGVWQLTI